MHLYTILFIHICTEPTGSIIAIGNDSNSYQGSQLSVGNHLDSHKDSQLSLQQVIIGTKQERMIVEIVQKVEMGQTALAEWMVEIALMLE